MNVPALRNIGIVLALAALLVLVPGGGTGASVATQVLSLGFLVALAYFASVMYREHRSDIYSLGDRRRAIVYVALGVALLTFTATTRLWQTGAGTVVWLALIGAAAYAVIAVVLAARKY